LASFAAPVVFVTFFSDSSAGESGFSMEFSSSGAPISSTTKYRHTILSNTSGYIVSGENEVAPVSNEIQTYILSPQSVTNDTIQTNISVSISSFGVDKTNCHKDTLSVYATPVTMNTGSTILTCTKGNDDACECVNKEITENLMLESRGFIAVFKPENTNDKKQFRLDWATSSGQISYTVSK
jgi:hypothetical protein